MKRRRKSLGLGAFLVFVSLVVVGGYALNSAGYIDNPFEQMAFLSNWANGGEQRFEQDFAVNTNSTSTFSLPPLPASADTAAIDLTALSETENQFQLPSLQSLDTSTTANDADTLDDGAFDGANLRDRNAISWADIGDVLYDLWFICATTAVFIVVQFVFKLTLKQIKHRLPAMAAAK